MIMICRRAPLGHGRTYRYFEGKPLYPFGFGLSYTKFTYSDLKASSKTARADDAIKVSVNVRNIGKQDGDEVVQLYVKDMNSRRNPNHNVTEGIQTCSYQRRIENVEISLPIESLKYYSVHKNDYVVGPGKYEVQIGFIVEQIRLKDTVAVVDRKDFVDSLVIEKPALYIRIFMNTFRVFLSFIMSPKAAERHGTCECKTTSPRHPS